MSIKFSVVGEALKCVLLDPPHDDAGICMNLREELQNEELTEEDTIALGTMTTHQWGRTLNDQLFMQWPEHRGDALYPIESPTEYTESADKWDAATESGKKRIRLLKYCIGLCKENPEKELVVVPQTANC